MTPVLELFWLTLIYKNNCETFQCLEIVPLCNVALLWRWSVVSSCHSWLGACCHLLLNSLDTRTDFHCPPPQSPEHTHTHTHVTTDATCTTEHYNSEYNWEMFSRMKTKEILKVNNLQFTTVAVVLTSSMSLPSSTSRAMVSPTAIL